MLIARALGDGGEGKIGFDEQSPNVFQPRSAYLNGGRAAKGLGEPMLQRTARHEQRLLQITDLQRLVRMGADVAERIGHERIVPAQNINKIAQMLIATFGRRGHRGAC